MTRRSQVGFVWVRFEQFVVRCFLLLVIVYPAVTIIFGSSEIGFVSHNLLILIDRFLTTDFTDSHRLTLFFDADCAGYAESLAGRRSRQSLCSKRGLCAKSSSRPPGSRTAPPY